MQPIVTAEHEWIADCIQRIYDLGEGYGASVLNHPAQIDDEDAGYLAMAELALVRILERNPLHCVWAGMSWNTYLEEDELQDALQQIHDCIKRGDRFDTLEMHGKISLVEGD